MTDSTDSTASFWNRATIAVVLALYGWSMMGLQLYLRAAATGDPLHRFRRLTMGRAVVALGAAAIVAALALALAGRRGHPRPAVLALVLVAGWVACLAAIWPI